MEGASFCPFGSWSDARRLTQARTPRRCCRGVDGADGRREIPGDRDALQVAASISLTFTSNLAAIFALA